MSTEPLEQEDVGDAYIKQLAEINRALGRRKIQFYKPYPKQLEFHNASSLIPREFVSERLLMAGNQLGKQLHDDTPVLTPVGWRRIADLVVGDLVISEDGTSTRVTGVYPQGVKPLYKLTFDRGETVLAGASHLWKYIHPKDRFAKRWSHGNIEPVPTYRQWTIGSTADILLIGGGTPTATQRVLMPHVQPVEFASQEIPLDPYFVGLMLGDGCMRTAVSLSSADEEIVETARRVADEFGLCVTSRGYDHRLVWPGGQGHGKGGPSAEHHPLKKILDGLGMWGKLSFQKCVPSSYLWNTPAIRLAVLQGLMDTDGSISKDGAIEFSTTSDQLATDVTFLVQSFGGKVWSHTRTALFTATNGEKKDGLPSHRLRIRLPHVPPFRLARKLARLVRPTSTCDERVLWKIEPAGGGPATCISVEHPSKTYVIEHFLVTHNTFSAGAEVAMHATGIYPPWFKGRRFAEATTGWVGSETGQFSRDVAQNILLGEVGEWGTGAIPGNLILNIDKAVHGAAGQVDTISVKHKSRGASKIGFKTYDQGRLRWQGKTQDWVWLDEECEEDIYSEAKTRVQAKAGMIFLTFTPLKGMSKVVLRFTKEKPMGTHVTVMTIYDAKHYTKAQADAIVAGFPEHQREARAFGIPMLGEGAVFPFSESLLKEPVIQIPAFWPRIAGIDIGYDHPTAVAWLAWDRDTDIVHVYDTHRLKKETALVHASAIKTRGQWIPVAWPHDAHQHDKGSGKVIADQYRKEGVNMMRTHATHPPTKQDPEGQGGTSFEAGIEEMKNRIQTGRLKVASHLENWFEEYRMYHREKGLVVKEFDDLMSATRIGVMMLRHAKIYTPVGTRPTVAKFIPSDRAMGVLG